MTHVLQPVLGPVEVEHVGERESLAQRGSKKDFVDVFALDRRFGLAEMLGFYRAKYGIKDIGHVLVALAYFDDADTERMPTLLRRWSWPTMKATIRRWIGATAQAP